MEKTSVLSTKTKEALTALQTETRDKQWLFRVILNLGTLSEVVCICNWFIGDAYLPYVMFTVLACSLIT